ncbi:cell division regulator GpsB [Alkalicoccus chagannorensis]|uniref:cell division regulator GpsB n=1 Tax=Alkalicoccus chagannorensis TaxID=427072 RepID=UPI0004233C4B|nr:cell division regulator GpsB [Alkalicoccus chagannorensis]
MEQRIPKLSKTDIYEKEFKTSMRGYNQEEVDQFLDDIIKDYEAYEARIKELEEKLSQKQSTPAEEPPRAPKPQQTGSTNYDILRRLSNLEKHVFGSRLHDS